MEFDIFSGVVAGIWVFIIQGIWCKVSNSWQFRHLKKQLKKLQQENALLRQSLLEEQNLRLHGDAEVLTRTMRGNEQQLQIIRDMTYPMPPPPPKHKEKGTKSVPSRVKSKIFKP